MQTEIAIIGGGLSGLVVAERLHQAGIDWHLVEARDRLGGRILSVEAGTAAPSRYDLGPAWIWPHNPRALHLADRLGVTVFPQFAEGRLVFQDPSGAVRRDLAFSTMAGSLRLEGGMSALTDGLAALVPGDRLHLGTPVTQIAAQGDQIRLTGPNLDLTASRAILALPPRIASRITFSPELPQLARSAMDAVPTWMAGQAKAVAVYPSPFWREQGFSGDGISQRGPMVEIHDASPKDANSGALFGFIGVPPQARLADPAGLRAAILRQFVEMFGPDAEAPDALILQDWAGEGATSTEADFATLSAHPTYGLPQSLTGLMEGRLIFAGSETAPEQGGFLEGALEAAEAAVAQITKTGTRVPS